MNYHNIIMLGIMAGSIVLLPGVHTAEAGGIVRSAVRGAEKGLLKRVGYIPKRVTHATGSIRSANSIKKVGIKTSKMNPDARFGKGEYWASTRNGALREKPTAKAYVEAVPTVKFKKNVWDLRDQPVAKVRTILPSKDIRGGIKNNVIGPKLGKEVGRVAGRHGHSIMYRSARNKHTSNIFIPGGLSRQETRMISPRQVGHSGTRK